MTLSSMLQNLLHVFTQTFTTHSVMKSYCFSNHSFPFKLNGSIKKNGPLMCALIFLLANYTQQGAELVFEPKTLYSRTYYSYHQGLLYYMKMPLLLRYRLYIPQRTCQKLNSSRNPLERFFSFLSFT